MSANKKRILDVVRLCREAKQYAEMIYNSRNGGEKVPKGKDTGIELIDAKTRLPYTPENLSLFLGTIAVMLRGEYAEESVNCIADFLDAQATLSMAMAIPAAQKAGEKVVVYTQQHKAYNDGKALLADYVNTLANSTGSKLIRYVDPEATVPTVDKPAESDTEAKTEEKPATA